MMDRDPIVNALAKLPNEHLWALGDSIKAMPASLVLGWLGDLVLWERKRRFGEVPGDLPEPSIPPDSIPIGLPLLHILTEPFRAHPGAEEVRANDPPVRDSDGVSGGCAGARRGSSSVTVLGVHALSPAAALAKMSPLLLAKMSPRWRAPTCNNFLPTCCRNRFPQFAEKSASL